MRQRAHRALIVAFGLAVSVGAIWWFVHRLAGHWAEVAETFRGINYLCLVPGIGLIAVLYWFRTVRWTLFLKPVSPVPRLSAGSATCIGFMANNVLPARLGELIGPYVLHRREGVRYGLALATVGLSRLFDLIGLSILLLITWVWMGIAAPGAGSGSSLTGAIWWGGLVLVLLAVAGTGVLLGLALFPEPFLAVGEAYTRALPSAWRAPAARFMHSIAEAMGFLKDWKGVAVAVLYSTCIWVSQGLSTYALARGLDVDIGVPGAFLATIAVAVAVAAPQAPAYIGPFQAAAALVAEGFHADKGEAGAFALLMWIVNIVPIVLVGLGFLWYEGLSLRKLAAAAREDKDDNAECGMRNAE